MNNFSIKTLFRGLSVVRRSPASVMLGAVFVFCAFGCASMTQLDQSAAVEPGTDLPANAIVLREGDALRITYPGAQRLDTAQQVRRDGKIVLPVFGEIKAAGFTPAELEKEILRLFGDQLVNKEVNVTLESSTYPVFINGAVLRPGKIEPNRPITALEAIMEVGGFDYLRANLKSVKVIRYEGTDVKSYTLDFSGLRKGRVTAPFYMKPSDIIIVPEKFHLF